MDLWQFDCNDSLVVYSYDLSITPKWLRVILPSAVRSGVISNNLFPSHQYRKIKQISLHLGISKKY